MPVRVVRILEGLTREEALASFPKDSLVGACNWSNKEVGWSVHF